MEQAELQALLGVLQSMGYSITLTPETPNRVPTVTVRSVLPQIAAFPDHMMSLAQFQHHSLKILREHFTRQPTVLMRAPSPSAPPRAQVWAWKRWWIFPTIFVGLALSRDECAEIACSEMSEPKF